MSRSRTSPAPGPIRLRAAGRADRELLDLCVGATIEIGCGEGSLGRHLASTGRIVLGIDVDPQAVAAAQARGAVVLQRSVFDAVPGEGRWQTVLLLGGSATIGDDPQLLLVRARDLLGPAGRIVVKLGDDLLGLTRDSVDPIAGAAGLRVDEIRAAGGREVAVLVR